MGRKGLKKGLPLLLAVFLLLLVSACGGQTGSNQGGSDNNTQQNAGSGNDQQSSAGQGAGTSEEKVYQIGITQIVEHPSLDAARNGFIDALKAAGFEEGKNVVYDIKYAQGNQDTNITIAQKFASDKKDLILAIATPSAQAAAQATKEIPILITAVTDPVAAGLVDSLEKPGGNVTGTTDMNPVKEQLELVTKLTQGKRVGILYNAGETNSVVQVDIAKKAAEELGLTLELVTVANSSEVKAAAESLASKVDAIYVPTDNTIVSALQSVVGVAEAKKLPLVVGEGDSVKGGGLITYGIDYYKLGYQTGEMAVKILKGEAKPADLPIESQKELKLYVNKTQADKIGIEIPKELLDQADEVY